MTDEEYFEFLHNLAADYAKWLSQDFKIRLAKWPTDFAIAEIHEVVGALLARQVTLGAHVAENPQLWNGHVAPLILRAMADVYINVAWLLGDPTSRCRNFVLYGLGQAKLAVERRKEEPTSPENTKIIEQTEAWIDSQRATFLLDINLGSWSGTSTRQMADEAGCIDFYNWVYTPFSACTHSMWQHVALYNLRQCNNPLHRKHRVPDSSFRLDIDPNYLHLAAKYSQKLFILFDKYFDVEVSEQSAFSLLKERFAILSE